MPLCCTLPLPPQHFPCCSLELLKKKIKQPHWREGYPSLEEFLLIKLLLFPSLSTKVTMGSAAHGSLAVPPFLFLLGPPTEFSVCLNNLP